MDNLIQVEPSAKELVDGLLVQYKLSSGAGFSNRGKEKALTTLRNFLMLQATKQMEQDGKVESSLLKELYETDLKLEELLEKKYSGVKGLGLKFGEKFLGFSKKAGEVTIKGAEGLVKAGAEVEERKREERARNPSAPTGVQLFTGSSASPWRNPVAPLASRNSSRVHSTLPYSSGKSLWNVR